jgi:hypothetical protein
VDYFFYCRDRDGAGQLRDRIVEEHWAFMDRFADGMIARGPTLTDDLEDATGSVHIVTSCTPRPGRRPTSARCLRRASLGAERRGRGSLRAI